MFEYQTYSCRHCMEKPKGRGKRQKPIYKRRSDEQLYEMIKEKILLLKKKKVTSVTAEKIAKECQVKVYRVKPIFMKLNQEGMLGQRINEAPMDSSRGMPIWRGCESSWCASYYVIK